MVDSLAIRSKRFRKASAGCPAGKAMLSPSCMYFTQDAVYTATTLLGLVIR